MTKQEAIETIKLALSQVEWDYPLNYAAAFDMAISAMEKQDAPDINVDTISRQMAIDLFPDDALEWDTKGGYIAPHLARRMIEELPSAQPDVPDICVGDMISRQAAIDAVIKRDANCGIDSAEVLKTLPPAQPEHRWIPCSETVDIPNHEVLACDLHGEMMFGYLAYDNGQWFCESYGDIMYDPIAWREKPEPYREEGEKR